MIVWVLIIHISTSQGPALTVIDNIADKQACEALKRSFDARRFAVPMTTCVPVRKAVVK